VILNNEDPPQCWYYAGIPEERCQEDAIFYKINTVGSMLHAVGYCKKHAAIGGSEAILPHWGRRPTLTREEVELYLSMMAVREVMES